MPKSVFDTGAATVSKTDHPCVQRRAVAERRRRGAERVVARVRDSGGRLSTNPSRSALRPYLLAALDFGPDSVDGWLNRIAAAELGESDQPFLDERDRSVDLGGTRIQLSPLEFGVLHTLATHAATPVSRADLLREAWGTSYDGGSNTVDVVIRSLRRKLGAVADRIETVRGVGYRLR